MSRQTSLKVLALTLSAFALTALRAGDPAPEFTALNQDGKAISLSQFRGGFVLLYFYPKDDTPGCTKQACNLRDEFAEIKRHGVTVLGASRQGVESHHQFRAKHRLPFDLLADEEGTLAAQYGIETIPVLGLDKRQSVLIGRDGKVLKVYTDVNPKTHASIALSDVKAAQAAGEKK